MASRGLFITLEGGEGAGKTTQIALLEKSLKAAGHDVLITREPGGTPGAEALRNVFIEQQGQNWPVPAQIMLMFAARAIHVDTLIRPALAAGKIVISDRFTDSTRAYQGYALGHDLMDIETVKRIAIGDFEPDITFIFDIDPAIGLSRTTRRAGTGDTFEAQDIAFHEKLRQGFLDIARRNPGRCRVLDAVQAADALAGQILADVRGRI